MQIKKYKQGQIDRIFFRPTKITRLAPWFQMGDHHIATTLHPPSSHFMMLLAHQFEFSSKKKVALHLCIPLEMHKEPCYSELQPGLHLKDAMTDWREKSNVCFSSQGPYEHRTTNARSHRGNSYFLAFSLLSLEIARRCWTYTLQKSNSFTLCEHCYETT